MSDQVDDDHWIWLPPEELTRLQREKTRDARDALERRLWSAEFDRLHQRTQSMLAEHDPLSKERRDDILSPKAEA